MSCEDEDDGFDCGQTMECSSSSGGPFAQQHQGPRELFQVAAGAPGPLREAALSCSGAPGSFLWRGQQQQQQQQEQHAAAAGDSEEELPAERLELVRAKALAGSRISASEVEARPEQQFPALPHLRSRPGGTGGVMRRTSSHI